MTAKNLLELEQMITDLAQDRRDVESKWYEWRMSVDDAVSRNEATIRTIAEKLYKISYIELKNGNKGTKPIEIAIGEIWEATALLRALNKIVLIVNQRPLSRKLFKIINVMFFLAITYAIFGYAVFGVPLIDLIKNMIK